MDTEHKFNPGDRVRFKGSVWFIDAFHGNRIYTVRLETDRPWAYIQPHHEFAYEDELTAVPLEQTLRQSIAQAKAKKGDAQ